MEFPFIHFNVLIWKDVDQKLIKVSVSVTIQMYNLFSECFNYPNKHRVMCLNKLINENLVKGWRLCNNLYLDKRFS